MPTSIFYPWVCVFQCGWNKHMTHMEMIQVVWTCFSVLSMGINMWVQCLCVHTHSSYVFKLSALRNIHIQTAKLTKTWQWSMTITGVSNTKWGVVWVICFAWMALPRAQPTTPDTQCVHNCLVVVCVAICLILAWYICHGIFCWCVGCAFLEYILHNCMLHTSCYLHTSVHQAM